MKADFQFIDTLTFILTVQQTNSSPVATAVQSQQVRQKTIDAFDGVSCHPSSDDQLARPITSSTKALQLENSFYSYYVLLNKSNRDKVRGKHVTQSTQGARSQFLFLKITRELNVPSFDDNKRVQTFCYHCRIGCRRLLFTKNFQATSRALLFPSGVRHCIDEFMVKIQLSRSYSQQL